MSYERECIIRGGLRVTVEYVINPADPVCGIPYPEVEIEDIVGIAGKYKNCDWLYKSLTKRDKANIYEQLNEPEY